MGLFEDRYEIEDVLHRYAFLTDTDQTSRIADEVFAHDAILDWGFRVISGREELRKWFHHPRVGLRATSHNITNVQVDLRGDLALSIHRVTAWHWFDESSSAGPAQEADVVLVGGYEDELRRDPEGWRVTRRVAHFFGPGGVGIGRELPPMIASLVEAAGERRPSLWDAETR